MRQQRRNCILLRGCPGSVVVKEGSWGCRSRAQKKSQTWKSRLGVSSVVKAMCKDDPSEGKHKVRLEGRINPNSGDH